MPWVKLDDGFFSNPKVIQAPPLARSLYVAGLCHCASGLTDGRITKAALPLLTAQTGATAKMATELTRVGLWHDQGDHYEVNDWSLFNRTAADISEQREAERLKKARQRASGAKAVVKGQGGRFVSRGDKGGDSKGDTPSCPPSGRRLEEGKDGSESRGNPVAVDAVDNRGHGATTSGSDDLSRGDTLGESPATRPDPTYPSSSPPADPSPPPPDEVNPEEDQPPNPERTATLAIEHMARCDLRQAETDGTPIRQPDRWLAKATATRRAAHHERLLEAATERPDADPVTLAEEIDPACGPDDGGLARAKAEAALSVQAAAADEARRAEYAAWIELADTRLAELDHHQRTQLEAQATETNPTLRRMELRHLVTQERTAS